MRQRQEPIYPDDSGSFIFRLSNFYHVIRLRESETEENNPITGEATHPGLFKTFYWISLLISSR